MTAQVSAIMNIYMDDKGIDSFIKSLQKLKAQKGKPATTWYEKKDKTRVESTVGWDHPNVEFVTSDGDTKLVVWKVE
jgi:hypothetical protein